MDWINRPAPTIIPGISQFLARSPVGMVLACALWWHTNPSPVAAQPKVPIERACESASRPIQTTLPIPLLDYLEKTSGSPFVHAFLMSHIAETDTSSSDIKTCIERFLKAKPTDLSELSKSRVSTSALIRALRQAEEERAEVEELRKAARLSLDTILGRLIPDPQKAALPVYNDLLRSAVACPRAGQPLCTRHRGTLEAIDSVRSIQKRIASYETPEKFWRDSLVRVQDAIRPLDSRMEALNAEIDRHKQSIVEDASLTASLTRTIADIRGQLDSVELASKVLKTTGQDLNGRAQALADSVAVQKVRFAPAVENARVALQDLRGLLRRANVEPAKLPPPTRDVTNAHAGAEPPKPAALLSPPRSLSSNILVNLTDFVIERAKQELLLSFFAELYRAMHRPGPFGESFPATYRLMQDATVPDRSRLSAVAAGRIPMPAWRATLALDFKNLPLAIVELAPGTLCKADSACTKRLLQVAPVAAIVQRLVSGHPVLDVLRDAPVIAKAHLGSSLPDDWARFFEGLGFVSVVAKTYLVQGLSLTADPINHPYVLSATALSLVPSTQKAAFIRLAVMEVGISEAREGFKVDSVVLNEAARRATTAVEAVATAMLSGATGSELASQTIVASVTGLRAADAISTLLAGSTARSESREIREQLLTTMEAIVVKDYGLAMARTPGLYRMLTGARLPPVMLTLTSLASSLASAQDGMQVRAAFEAAASPVGGWQAKRYREGRRASISAFPGFSFGREWLVDGPASNTAGGSLPIGPELQLLRRSGSSSGLSRCFVVCSVGAFVPILDLGTLLTYRLSSSKQVEAEPNAKLRQVFAPGFYFTLGVGRYAVAVLAGGQFLPAIRKVADDSGLTGNAWRAGLGVTVDVTLFQW